MDAYKIKKSKLDIVNEILGYISVAIMWLGLIMMMFTLS